MRLTCLGSLLALCVLIASACDLQGPQDCPAIDGSGGAEPVEDYPEYADAAAKVVATAPVLEALEPDVASGDLQIVVREVESIEVWHSYSCHEDTVTDILGAHVRAELTSADGSLSLEVPALVVVDDDGVGTVRFSDWSSIDPDVLARVPDTDLADDAEIGMLELEVTDTDAALYRTDTVLCTMVEGCSNTQRHLLLRWSTGTATG